VLRVSVTNFKGSKNMKLKKHKLQIGVAVGTLIYAFFQINDDPIGGIIAIMNFVSIISELNKKGS